MKILKGIKKVLLITILILSLLSQSISVAASSVSVYPATERGGLEPVTAVLLEEAPLHKYSSPQYSIDTHKYSDADYAYWTKFRSEYYYNYLSPCEKEFWDSIESFCITLATTTTDFSGIYWIPCDASIPTARIRTIMTLFLYSNPQYYFLEPYITYSPGGGSLSLYSNFRDGETRATCTTAFTSTIDRWVAQFSSSSKQEEKVKLAHDIVCKNTNYTYNTYDQSAYSMVCLGQTACTGYAKVFSMLSNAAGVDAAIISGSDHAWNIVNLHGVWYELDAACDDGYSSKCYYDFYCKSRVTFLADRYVNHNIASMYLGMLPATPYDLIPGAYYFYPYFTSGRNTYFIVNHNTSVGELLATRIDGTDTLPEAITSQNETYLVIGAHTSDNSSTNSKNHDLIKAFVERMYTVALGRTADTGGVNYWTEQLISGQRDAAALACGFILSPEFTTNAYTNTEYIKILYSTFFSRTADSAGQAYWSGKLSNGMSREEVLAGFVNSAEFFNLCKEYGMLRGLMRRDASTVNPGIYRFSARLYSTILERDIDMAGIDYWAAAIDTGTHTPGYAAACFLASEEYLAKLPSDEKYIMTLYRTFMDRESDLGGLTYWKSNLQSGTSREALSSSFASSAEFQEIMVEYGL